MTGMIFADILVLCVGIYLLITGIRMLVTGDIGTTVLAEEEVKKCKDKKGFVRYMAPRLVFFSAVLFLLGVAGLVFDFFLELVYWRWIEFAVFIVAFIQFYLWFRKGKRRFCS